MVFAPLYKKLVQAEFVGIGIVLGHVGRRKGRCRMAKKKRMVSWQILQKIGGGRGKFE